MKKISLDSISDILPAAEKEIAATVQRGRSSAISWMGIERKASGRVSEYLKKQGFNQEEISLVIKSLTEDGYLDDERLARRVVKQRQGRQSESRRSLSQRMSRMGLEGIAIERALEAAEEDDQAALIVLKQRFSRDLESLQTDVDRNDGEPSGSHRYDLTVKAARFLAGRGFSRQTIIKALGLAGLSIDSFD